MLVVIVLLVVQNKQTKIRGDIDGLFLSQVFGGCASGSPLVWLRGVYSSPFTGGWIKEAGLAHKGGGKALCFDFPSLII